MLPAVKWKQGATDCPPCAVCGRFDVAVREVSTEVTRAIFGGSTWVPRSGGAGPPFSDVRLVLTQPVTTDLADLQMLVSRRRAVVDALATMSGPVGPER